jgi:hypothetical protein
MRAKERDKPLEAILRNNQIKEDFSKKPSAKVIMAIIMPRRVIWFSRGINSIPYSVTSGISE